MPIWNCWRGSCLNWSIKRIPNMFIEGAPVLNFFIASLIGKFATKHWSQGAQVPSDVTDSVNFIKARLARSQNFPTLSNEEWLKIYGPHRAWLCRQRTLPVVSMLSHTFKEKNTPLTGPFNEKWWLGKYPFWESVIYTEHFKNNYWKHFPSVWDLGAKNDAITYQHPHFYIETSVVLCPQWPNTA